MNHLIQASDWLYLPWLPLVGLALLALIKVRRSLERDLQRGAFDAPRQHGTEALTSVSPGP